MDAGKVLDRSGTRMRLAFKQVLVIGIVLAAVGYGMSMMGEHSPTSPAEAATAGSAREAAVVPRPASPEDRVQREEDPRPCEPEQGINERCTY